MKDYIERELALTYAKKAWGKGLNPVEYLEEVPAANVKPVVRGEWIWEENEWQYRCSACRITFDYDKNYELFDHCYQYASFCPNCGADMRGE